MAMLVLIPVSSKMPVLEGYDFVELHPPRSEWGGGPQTKDNNTCRNLKSWNKINIIIIFRSISAQKMQWMLATDPPERIMPSLSYPWTNNTTHPGTNTPDYCLTNSMYRHFTTWPLWLDYSSGWGDGNQCFISLCTACLPFLQTNWCRMIQIHLHLPDFYFEKSSHIFSVIYNNIIYIVLCIS